MNLVAHLAAAGLEPAGPLGPGSDGTRWSVRDPSGRRWALTVVHPTPEEGTRLRRRVAALTVHHPHVADVGPVVDLADGALALLQEEIPGADLATVRAARGRWAPGEVVTVLVPLAEALAALHDAGLAHGDVVPGNIVLRPDGRPVLVDVVSAAEPGERGTPGAAAPESLGGVDAPGDVHALGRLGLLLLDDGADHGADHGPAHGSAGGPGGGSGGGSLSGRAALLDCLTAAVQPDPGRRPTARDMATWIYEACPPEPVAMPDPAVLARLALRRLAEPAGDRTLRVSRGRHRSARPRRAPVLALVALVLGAGVAVSAVLENPADPGTSVGVTARVVAADPVTAAVRLTAARARALAAGDLGALRAITVPGSAAAQADLRAAARIGAGAPSDGTTPPGEVSMVVRSAARVATRCTGCAEVRLVAAATLVVPEAAPAGTAVARGADVVPPGETGVTAVPVILVLRRMPEGWRVSEVRAG